VAARLEPRIVNVAGVAQGIALVTFPAASTIFTDPSDYGLTNSAYGAMFLPQAALAIMSAFLGARWARHVGTRRVYLTGLVANAVSMTLLVFSAVVMHEKALAYVVLLVATATLGLGFGFTVPALNTFAAGFHPAKADGAVLVLNALLGLGTALAPLVVAIFVGLGFWWGLPLCTAAGLTALLVISTRLPFTLVREATSRSGETERTQVPKRFIVFAAFAVGYGVCETMNGNWASIDMKHLGASATQASIALTVFWACVTLGRIGVAVLQRWLSTPHAYEALPIVLAGALVAVAVLPDDRPALGILSFGLAGLGCSALLPLTISFGQGQLVVMSTAVAGGIIAFYQVGYGIAAFGAGPLQDAGVSLSTLYGISAGVALGLAILAVVIARHGAVPSSVHPRPAPHRPISSLPRAARP
jgi:MFS family permease